MISIFRSDFVYFIKRSIIIATFSIFPISFAILMLFRILLSLSLLHTFACSFTRWLYFVKFLLAWKIVSYTQKRCSTSLQRARIHGAHTHKHKPYTPFSMENSNRSVCFNKQHRFKSVFTSSLFFSGHSHCFHTLAHCFWCLILKRKYINRKYIA